MGEVIDFKTRQRSAVPVADLQKEIARINRACIQGNYINPIYPDSNTPPVASLLLALSNCFM